MANGTSRTTTTVAADESWRRDMTEPPWPRISTLKSPARQPQSSFPCWHNNCDRHNRNNFTNSWTLRSLPTRPNSPASPSRLRCDPCFPAVILNRSGFRPECLLSYIAQSTRTHSAASLNRVELVPRGLNGLFRHYRVFCARRRLAKETPRSRAASCAQVV